MRDQAARVCRALCCTRVVEEMHQRRGTRIAEHLKLVLSIIDRQVQGSVSANLLIRARERARDHRPWGKGLWALLAITGSDHPHRPLDDDG